jgi:hypothetical protein
MTLRIVQWQTVGEATANEAQEPRAFGR